VLREFRRQHQAYGSLQFAGSKGALAVDANQVRRLSRYALELIAHKAVHNLHRAARHRHLAVDRLQGAVHIRVPAALRLAVGVLAASGLVRSGLRRGGSHNDKRWGKRENAKVAKKACLRKRRKKGEEADKQIEKKGQHRTDHTQHQTAHATPHLSVLTHQALTHYSANHNNFLPLHNKTLKENTEIFTVQVCKINLSLTTKNSGPVVMRMHIGKSRNAHMMPRTNGEIK